MTTRYTVFLDFDEEGPGYIATVPALPGCLTQGATIPQTLDRIKQAIEGHIAALRELGEEMSEEQSRD